MNIDKYSEFLINGTSLPYVPFDIGESYGGVLPVGSGSNGTFPSGNATEQQLYFWFFPSENPEATDEILIWLNGGVSCARIVAARESTCWLCQITKAVMLPDPTFDADKF